MTTKKLVILICGIVAAVVLLVALFVGVIVSVAFYTISKSEAAETAKTFLKSNEKLKQDIGEVKDFGAFITGSINTNNAEGAATLYLKVIGARRTANARVDMRSRSNSGWRVTGASYENEAGHTVELLDAYEPATVEEP